MSDVEIDLEDNLESQSEIFCDELDIAENIVEDSDISHDESYPDTDSVEPDVNCLYLTVKKDFSLSIVRNKIKKAIKSSWKIAVSVFVLNFLSSFF